MNHELAEAMAMVGQQLAHPLRLQLLQHIAEAGPCPFSELADAADATPAQVSNHLRSLRDAELVVTHREGRQSLYRIENAYVAELLANMTAIVDPEFPASLPDQRPHSEARRCYDHIGGQLGVGILRALHRDDALSGALVNHGGLEAGAAAQEVLPRFGVGDWTTLLDSRRRFAYCCPDWTERTPHLGGVVAAEIRRHVEARGWVHQIRNSRALSVSQPGRKAFRDLGVAV